MRHHFCQYFPYSFGQKVYNIQDSWQLLIKTARPIQMVLPLATTALNKVLYDTRWSHYDLSWWSAPSGSYFGLSNNVSNLANYSIW